MPDTLPAGSAKALREERAKVAATIYALRDKANTKKDERGVPVGLDAAEEEQWAKANADYNAFTRAIEQNEIADRVTADQKAAADAAARIGRDDFRGQSFGESELVAGEKNRSLALAAWFKAQLDEDLTPEQANACRAIGFNPMRRELAVGLYSTGDLQRLQQQFQNTPPSRALDTLSDFRATLSTGNPTGGGYLQAPEQLRRGVELNMLYYGGMRQVSDTIRTASGEPMSWLTADDTTNTGVQLGESTSFGSSVDFTLAKVLWSAYKFSSKPILVPSELLQDSVIDLPGMIGQMFGERLGRITNTKYTTGTGAATPKGIITCAGTFTPASATALTFDDILGLEHSIDPAYRTVGCGYMAHDTILLAIRKLKDGMGQPIWQSNWQSGQPDRLNGYGVTLNQDMDSTIASGKKTLLFGQLNRYKIRSVGEMRMYRLQERYRDTDQDGFVAFIREDGNLLTAGTAPVKYLSH